MDVCTTDSALKTSPGFLPALIQRVAWFPLRLLFWLFLSYTVRGREHLRALPGPVIIASNHVSELDPLLIVAALPFSSRHLPLFYVSREKKFYAVNWRSAIYGGGFFRMMGAYPAYEGLNDYQRALVHHLHLIRRGKSIGIFPLGGIRPRGTPLTPRGGAIYLAHATQTPLIPVRIEGAEHLTYAGFFLRRHQVRLTFGAPLLAQDLISKEVVTAQSSDPCEAGAKKLMQRIETLGT